MLVIGTVSVRAMLNPYPYRCPPYPDTEGEADIERERVEQDLRVTKKQLSEEIELRAKDAEEHANRVKEVPHASYPAHARACLRPFTRLCDRFLA